jgi:hypothetical protein
LVGIGLPFGWDRPFNYLILKADFGSEIRKFNEVELYAVDNFTPRTKQRDATVLATGKGWVLPVLAMLGPKPGLCVAARGSGPGAPRGAALALRCAP